MSHYKEYKMGLIDKDEFDSACREEFAGEESRDYYSEMYRLAKSADPKIARQILQDLKREIEESNKRYEEEHHD